VIRSAIILILFKIVPNSYKEYKVGHIHLKKKYLNISPFKDNQKAYLAFSLK
jgi:hypothetical protein